MEARNTGITDRGGGEAGLLSQLSYNAAPPLLQAAEMGMAGRRREIVGPRSCFVVGGAGEGGCGGESGRDRRSVHGDIFDVVKWW